MTSFNQDSEFTMRHLSLLNEIEIPVMSSLSSYTPLIKKTLGFSLDPGSHSLDTLLNAWLGGGGNVRPTWKNLLSLIRQLHLDDLAHQVETCLCGATIEQHHKEAGEKEIVLAEEGHSDLESQLSLRDDFIHQLKQEMATLVKVNKELKTENEELKAENVLLRSQPFMPPIKEEDAADVEDKRFALKTKCKEEVVTDTKTKPISAQPTAVWDLRGVEVCEEIAVVVKSSHAQQIEWKDFGLKLTIHEGSLPADVQQCVITIKASLTGQYEFPENSHLVSTVFWLHCEPMCKLTKPITVEMQHCARSENIASFNLKFVRAVCSQKELPYTFKQLRGNFTSHSSYGVIELDSFSGLAITQEGSEDREYCSQLFYLGQPSLCKIHFVVTWNLEAHLTVVKEEYERKRAVPGLHQLVDFESDTIILDIPKEGITINGWEITPLISPVVTKKQVDNFREGKVTPCCQLKAEVSRRRKKKIPPLKYQVSLKGTKNPSDFFTIDLPVQDLRRSPTFGDLAIADPSAQSVNSRSPTATESVPPPAKRGRLGDGASQPTPSTSKQNYKPELREAFKELVSVATQWKTIGTLLGLPGHLLDNIKSDEDSVHDRLLTMLSEWFKQTADSHLSWTALADAVEIVNSSKAKEIRQRYGHSTR